MVRVSLKATKGGKVPFVYYLKNIGVMDGMDADTRKPLVLANSFAIHFRKKRVVVVVRNGLKG